MKCPSGKNSEPAPLTRQRVAQRSRQLILSGGEPSNAGTLADQIAAFEGALTAAQLAKFLSISAISLYKMAKSGRIPSLRIGASVRFCPATVSLAAAAWRLVRWRLFDLRTPRSYKANSIFSPTSGSRHIATEVGFGRWLSTHCAVSDPPQRHRSTNWANFPKERSGELTGWSAAFPKFRGN